MKSGIYTEYWILPRGEYDDPTERNHRLDGQAKRAGQNPRHGSPHLAQAWLSTRHARKSHRDSAAAGGINCGRLGNHLGKPVNLI